jgi:hypothetical protein
MAEAADRTMELQRTLVSRDERIEALTAQLAALRGTTPVTSTPQEVDQAFTSFAQWNEWFKANPWASDKAYIASIVDRALLHGVEDGYLGFAQPDQISVTDENYRETFFAHGMNARLRAVLHMLTEMKVCQDHWTPRIYGSEALTPFALLLRGRFARYIGSEYAPSEEDRARIYPVPHQDITNLTFPDGGFDLVVSNEVLEHVPSLERAFSEIARVLAPGGVLLATFPFAYFAEDTQVRAVLREDGTVSHLCEPEYHGNPMDPEGGSLVFQVPGWDVLPLALRQGFRSAAMHFVSSKARGITGAELAGIFILKAVK